MRASRVGIGLAAVLTGVPAATQAQAQKVARVREVVRVVKKTTGPQGRLVNAPINTPILQNERVRTGGRSAVGVRFPDMSILRLGELSELVVTSADRRRARLVRGQVVMDFRAPGRISGGNAIAAVRGTKVHFQVNEETGEAEVRCYEGRVFVSSEDNPVAAGSPTALTATTLVDPNLAEETDDWRGGEIRFVDGPLNGQRRQVTAFDAATGTVTFAPAVPAPAPGAPVSGYVLAKKPGTEIVELGRNSGTTVPRTGSPRPAYRVPNENFAYIQRNPYFQQMEDGTRNFVLPGTAAHDFIQDREFPYRRAIRDATEEDNQFFCDFGSGDSPGKFGLRRFRGLSAQSQRQPVFLAQNTQLPSPERIFQPQVLTRAPAVEAGKNQVWRFEPFAVGTNDDDVLGTRLRYQAVSGDVYTEIGYRYQLLNGQSEHDLSEAFFELKGSYGRLAAGRQHLFLGPANNTRTGTLLDLESSDTILYELPLKGGFRQMGGYVIDSDIFRDGGFSGGFLRGQAPVGLGYAGYSALFNREEETSIGWSVDASQPLRRNVLDVYGEAGIDSHNRQIYTAGFYVPWFYHQHKLDVFVEYARREDVEERATLRLRRDLGGGFLAIAFLDQRLGSNHLVGGGGILWSRAFR